MGPIKPWPVSIPRNVEVQENIYTPLGLGSVTRPLHHFILAHKFLNTALQDSGSDPLCRFAMPTGAASMEETVELCVDPCWESTVFNLGYALPKARLYQLAATYARCISLCPEKGSGYSA
jgi:hypothetical protein